MLILKTSVGLAMVVIFSCQPSDAFSVPAECSRQSSPASLLNLRTASAQQQLRDPAVPSRRAAARIGAFSGTGTSSSTGLAAVPPAVSWAIGHVIGGTAGTGFVIPATKKGGWYNKIDLPDFTPPNFLFGPVWASLYACMGVAAFRISQRTCSPVGSVSAAMKLWWAHYALNLSWAPTFFGAKNLRFGAGISCGLIGTLLAVISKFFAIDRVAGLLLLPYLGWITFATFLNCEICKRNPTDADGYNNAKFQAGLCRLQADAAAFADS